MLISDDIPARVQQRYPIELSRLRRLIECAWLLTRNGPKTGSASVLLATGMIAHAVTLSEAAYNLFCLGYENATAIIVRSMAELAIDCGYIWTRDTDQRARLYLRHSVVAAVKAAAALSDGEERIAAMIRAPEGLLPADVHSVADAKRWVKKEFGFKAEWTTVALPDRAKEANISPMYSMIYRLGCTEAHSNIAALPLFGEKRTALVVRSGAHMPAGPPWIVGASGALLFVLAHLVEVVGGDRHQIEALAAEWNEPTPP